MTELIEPMEIAGVEIPFTLADEGVCEICRTRLTEERVVCIIEGASDTYIVSPSFCYQSVLNEFIRIPEDGLILWPSRLKGTGDCVFCDCFSNAGLRLGTLDDDDIICIGCADRLFREMIQVVQDNREVFIAEFL